MRPNTGRLCDYAVAVAVAVVLCYVTTLLSLGWIRRQK